MSKRRVGWMVPVAVLIITSLAACTSRSGPASDPNVPPASDVDGEPEVTTLLPETLDGSTPPPTRGLTDTSVAAVTDVTSVPPDHPMRARVTVGGGPVATGAVGATTPVLAGTDATGRAVELGPGRARALVFVQPGDEASRAQVADLVTFLDQFGLPGDGSIALAAVATFWRGGAAEADGIGPADWLLDLRWRGESLIDDPDSSAAAAFGVVDAPAVVLVDAAGTVTGRYSAAASTQIVADALLMAMPAAAELPSGSAVANAAGGRALGDIEIMQAGDDVYVSLLSRTVIVAGRELDASTLPDVVVEVAHDGSPFGPPRSPPEYRRLSDTARVLVPEVAYFRAECRRGEGEEVRWVTVSADQLRVLLEAGSFSGPASIAYGPGGEVTSMWMLPEC